MVKSGSVKYIMPYSLAQAYLKDRKGEDKKMDPIKYLVKVVNEEFCILRNCVDVVIN